MDPGKEVLKNLDKTPNLVSEEPSDSTPPNTSYMDMPQKDFSNMLDKQRKVTAEKCSKQETSSEDFTRTQPEKGSVEDFTIADWDASTNYQDKDHKDDLCKRM
ncbi:MAG: hypothetical protein EXX96DRAFT_575097 [Benjaminiella poitrasii]|nr:MAG: hypothetical protein EXX96DRAFT_575097 [Benjaminiella poitrasii]